MKIRTAADAQKLDEKIQRDLGIDVKKYRNPEVAEQFVELLIFPQYIINWGIRPIIISFFLYIAGFFIVDLVHVQYLIYFVFGLVLFLLSGLFFGLLFLTWKIKSDILSIIEYSMDIMRSCVEDLNQVNNRMTVHNRKDVMGLLFKGVIHLVTIPMLTEIISNKVPLIGGLFKRIIKRILTIVSDRVQFGEELLEQELNKKDHEPKLVQLYAQSIGMATNGLSTILSVAIRIVQFPIKIGFGISAGLLGLFLWLIW